MAEDLLDRHGLDAARCTTLVGEALLGADDGELFVEHRVSESLVFDDGKMKSAAYDVSEGFGLRAVAGETVAEVLEGLFASHDRLRGYVLDDQGGLRRHIVVFVDGEAVRDLARAVRPTSEVVIMQALSGG